MCFEYRLAVPEQFFSLEFFSLDIFCHAHASGCVFDRLSVITEGAVASAPRVILESLVVQRRA